MNPVEKALWFIERHLATNIALEDIARSAGISKFHMTRSFSKATDRSVMRYVRARRLSEAAKALLSGAPDILSVSLDASYNSHEAFTRAFRSEFGLTPEAVRARGEGAAVALVEPLKLDDNHTVHLNAPRLENRDRLLISGIGQRYTCETSAAIPSQWQRFLPYLGRIPMQIETAAYGVRCNDDSAGNFDYVCGVPVTDFSRSFPTWTCLRVPEQTYAVFYQADHVSSIRSAWNLIWNQWLPESEYQAVDAPCFEVYGEQFDSTAGQGGFQLWIAVKKKIKGGRS